MVIQLWFALAHAGGFYHPTDIASESARFVTASEALQAPVVAAQAAAQARSEALMTTSSPSIFWANAPSMRSTSTTRCFDTSIRKRFRTFRPSWTVWSQTSIAPSPERCNKPSPATPTSPNALARSSRVPLCRASQHVESPTRTAKHRTKTGACGDHRRRPYPADRTRRVALTCMAGLHRGGWSGRAPRWSVPVGGPVTRRRRLPPTPRQVDCARRSRRAVATRTRERSRNRR